MDDLLRSLLADPMGLLPETRHAPPPAARIIKGASIQIRQAEEGGPLVAEGLAIPYGVWADIGPQGQPFFRERILQGAAKDHVDDGDVRALWNHQVAIVLGRTAANTLALSETEEGLRDEIKLPETASREAESIRRGDVSGQSFGFDVEDRDEEWETVNNLPHRTIMRFSALPEVSPATFPAYPTSGIGFRSLPAAFARAGLSRCEKADAIRGLLREQARMELRSGHEAALRKLRGEPARVFVSEQRGEGYGRYLNSHIDRIVEESGGDLGRADLIGALAEAAGRDESTVSDILSGRIDCPTLDPVVAGLQAAIDRPLEEGLEVLEDDDGCSYERSRAKPPSRRARLARLEIRLALAQSRLRKLEGRKTDGGPRPGAGGNPAHPPQAQAEALERLRRKGLADDD